MGVRRIILSNLGVLAAGLATLELVFGNWLSLHNINLLNLRKDLTVTFDAADLYEDPDSTIVTYKRDRYGLRGPYQDVSQIDILTIGGSTTDQRCLSEGRTWQDVLAREFEERERKIQIANAGVDGQTTRGNLKTFDLWFPAIPDLRSRFVLLYVGINDFWLKESDTSRFDALEGGQASVLDKLLTRSAIYSLYRTLKGMQAARAAGLPHSRMNFSEVEWVSQGLYRESHQQLISEKLSRYERRLLSLDEKVRQMGAVPIFVTQHTMFYTVEDDELKGVSWEFKVFETKLNGVDIGRLMNLLNQRTMDVCRQCQGVCLDLASELEFDFTDFYDQSHNTPRGATKIGRFLFEKLEDII